MIISRSKPATDISQHGQSLGSKRIIPEIEDFLEKRDYTGALTLIEFIQNDASSRVILERWSAFCYFHLGNYSKSLEIYEQLKTENESADDIDINIAVCYFYLGMYNESQESANLAPNSSLKTRLQFHLAHKLKSEDEVMQFHQKLNNVIEDQLCLASIHFLRGHYQEAIDIYKKLLSENRTLLALNIYVALCYYKLDYYDVSQEVLSVYLNQYPDSTIAVNLKACNLFRLYNGKAAEAELKSISSEQHSFGQDLVKHNLVVFKNGDGALKILPPLVDIVTEARLNLAVWRLRAHEPQAARELLDSLEPAAPREYILKGIIYATLGQESGSEEQLKTAQQCLHIVGSSASECDTIPGRQCMASSYFLYNQFDEVLVYLNSIKSFFANDDNFNFNYGQAKTATGNYREAEECLLSVKEDHIKNTFTYIACLCRCYVMNQRGHLAWDISLKLNGTPDCFSLLQIIANDSYRMGDFVVAARAFHMLDRLDPNPEFWEGERGACAGIAQLVAAGAGGLGSESVRVLPASALREALSLLRSSGRPQADTMARTMLKWVEEKRIS